MNPASPKWRAVIRSIWVIALAASCRAINRKKAKSIGRTKKGGQKSKSENENARRGGNKEAPAEPLVIRYDKKNLTTGGKLVTKLFRLLN